MSAKNCHGNPTLSRRSTCARGMGLIRLMLILSAVFLDTVSLGGELGEKAFQNAYIVPGLPPERV